MRNLAELHIPANQDMFLTLTWSFLGRCEDVFCVPHDIPTLVKAIDLAQQRATLNLQTTVLLGPGTYESPDDITIPQLLSLVGDGPDPHAIVLNTPCIILGEQRGKGKGKSKGKQRGDVSNAHEFRPMLKQLTVVPHVRHNKTSSSRFQSQTRKRSILSGSPSPSKLKPQPTVSVVVPSLIEHCIIEGHHVGIKIRRSGQGTIIEHSEVCGAQMSGIDIHGLVSVVSCTFAKCALGIRVQNARPIGEAQKCVIRGSYFRGDSDLFDSDVIEKMDGIMIDQAACASIEANNFHSCTASIILQAVGAVTVDSNTITDSKEAAVSIKERWRTIRLFENEIVGCQWGVLSHYKTGGSLEVNANLIRGARVAAITLFRVGQATAARPVQIVNNRLEDSHAGVNISGAARRTSLGCASFATLVSENTIVNCHKEAVRISRGASSHVVGNTINKNGRGIVMEDGILGACRTLVEGNSFNANNGWSIRFALIVHARKCAEPYRKDLLQRIDSVPMEDYRKFLLLTLAPQVQAIIRSATDLRPTTANHQVFVSLVSLDASELLKLLTSKQTLFEFAKTLTGKSPSSKETRIHTCKPADSVVQKNVFIGNASNRALHIKVDTILQQPYAQDNLNEDGVLIEPLCSKEGSRLSTSTPHWYTHLQCMLCLQKRLGVSSSSILQDIFEGKDVQNGTITLEVLEGIAEHLRSKSALDLEEILASEDEQLRFLSRQRTMDWKRIFASQDDQLRLHGDIADSAIMHAGDDQDDIDLSENE